MITGVSGVVLPVSDQDVAKAFWTDQAGFECLQDTTMGDERWVEVRPRDGGPVISLVAGEPAQPAQLADPATRCVSVTTNRCTAESTCIVWWPWRDSCGT